MTPPFMNTDYLSEVGQRDKGLSRGGALLYAARRACADQATKTAPSELRPGTFHLRFVDQRALSRSSAWPNLPLLFPSAFCSRSAFESTVQVNELPPPNWTFSYPEAHLSIAATRRKKIDRFMNPDRLNQVGSVEERTSHLVFFAFGNERMAVAKRRAKAVSRGRRF